jgi:hypothetical protein
MKKLLLSTVTFFTILLAEHVNAQCNFINPGVKLNFTQTQVGGGCLINIDLSFDLSHNDGNKWVNIHLWRTSDYPALTYSSTPTAAQLANTVANIVIDQRAIPISLNATFPPDNSVIVQSAGLSVSRVVGATYDRYTINNISLLVPTGCNISQSFTGDAWSSQSNNDNVVHCTSLGFSFLANDPQVTGLLFCPLPRNYNVTISTTVAAPGVSGTYNVYRDDNGNGNFDGIATDPIVATNVPWSAVNGTNYNSGQQTYSGNNSKPEADRALFVVVSTVGLSNTIFTKIENSCIPLPVEFKSFNATRSKSNVILKWETGVEINNSGFAIERNVNGTWAEVAFVPSLASNGSSDIALSYSYIDLNTNKGISQYRIKQTDKDAKSKYSEIRSVRGEDQVGKVTIYPNPTNNGKVNVAFDDASVIRDIIVSDMSGRLVKQIKGIANNNIQIENLTPGMYSLRIVVPVTGEQIVQKIVVNKR